MYTIYIYICICTYVFMYIYIPIYNNDGLRNNYGIRLKVSCLRNHQTYI